MKVTSAATLLFASLAIASPAAIPQPDTEAGAIARPLEVEARAPVLEARKKSKPKVSNGNSTGAANMMAPSVALSLGAAGLSVIEIVRLWG